MSHRDFKDPLYSHFARIGHAMASPKRIELLDLLAQGEKTVEQLAEQSDIPVKNASAHLRVLREARLVMTRREGTFVHYRLAGDDVVELVGRLQAVARKRLAEVEQVSTLYLTKRDQFQPVTREELRKLVRDDLVTVIDARPREEFEAGHIPGALSIPVVELKRRLGEIPKDREVIAYCRGPYCVYSVEAVNLLRKHGYRARRAQEGLPEWRASGLPIEPGVARSKPAKRKAGRHA
jgi:rhodanese-related sulfurtransferase